MSSFLLRHRYVSWCVESSAGAGTTAATTQIVLQSADAASIPLLLSSPETVAGDGEASPTFTKSAATSHVRQEAEDGPAAAVGRDEACEEEEERRENLRAPGGGDGGDNSAPLLHSPKIKLKRSSPVMLRRRVAWQERISHSSAPSSSDTSPVGSVSPGHHRLQTPDSVEEVGGFEPCHSSPLGLDDANTRCGPVSPSTDVFLSAGCHRPPSGRQKLADRQRLLTGCDAPQAPPHTPHTPGHSTILQYRRDWNRSNIPEFSDGIFKTSCELEKENAHFIVVDMVLEALEGVKWTLSLNRETDTHSCTHTHTNSAVETQPCGQKRQCKLGCCSAGQGREEHCEEDTDSEHACMRTHGCTRKDTEGVRRDHNPPKTFSVLSTDSGFEDCGVDASLTRCSSLTNQVCAVPQCSAEWLAQQLVLDFKKAWFPTHEPRWSRQSLRSSLQELPGTGNMVSSESLTEEIRLRTRMRGSLSWAPPHFQIIFTVQPGHRRSEVVAQQHFLCAGCGTEVEQKYIKKLRYCDYLGRYFCDCCHSGSESVIPGRVLSSWDFGRYPVSDFSKQLLDSVWHQPLFDLTCVGKTLYNSVKELDKLRELQEQLMAIVKLLKACRLSQSLMAELEQLPAHLIKQPYLYSMDDFWRVKKGQLVTQARAILHTAVEHVKNCELCLARGFICEFCREKDVIFPFQSDICKRCPVCKACFHKQCFVDKKCPKCSRIQLRKRNKDKK